MKIGRYHDGSSSRLVIVAREGLKNATLLSVGDLEAIDIPKTDLRHVKAVAAGTVRPRRLIGLLREGLKVEGRRIRVGLVKDVLDDIRRNPGLYSEG